MLPDMSPIVFAPLYQQRVWGGRLLETRFGRQLPDAVNPYGESWEISDRPEACSRVLGGCWDGLTLHDLWCGHRAEVFGDGLPDVPRFPLLIKILDARDDLSIQVHPPAAVAASLGGEPKTEMWFIAHAEPGAKLYVGLKPGVTRDQFEAALATGAVAEMVHVLEPRAGEAIFIPSGRLHAIGAGLLIFEIQQNSDTTYRVFDWHRLGLDGKPRELHVDASLACIDFADTTPAMTSCQASELASCAHFHVARESAAAGSALGHPDPEHFSLVAVVDGLLADDLGRQHGPGSFLLIPRGAVPLDVLRPAELLRIRLPG